MRCPNCNKEMKNVMHFETGRNFSFHECKNCWTQTHQKRIHFEETERNNGNPNTRK